jgi:hypothetical protein
VEARQLRMAYVSMVASQIWYDSVINSIRCVGSHELIFKPEINREVFPSIHEDFVKIMNKFSNITNKILKT